MKKLLCMIVAVVISTAFAQGELFPYVSLSGGYAIANDIDYDAGYGMKGSEELDGGYTFDAAFGVGFAEAFRTELAIGYQLNEFEDDNDVDMTLITGMLNVYFDFNNSTRATPFVLAGMGVVDIEIDSEDDTVFGGQVGAGVGFDINDSFILDLKYKYLMVDDADIGGVDVEDIGGHLIQVGIRLPF